MPSSRQFSGQHESGKGKLIKTWIWAVDPVDSDPSAIESMTKLIRSLAGGVAVRIVPVAVASPDYLNWPREFSGLWTEAFVETVKKSMARVLSGVSLVGLEAPEVIAAPAHSRKEAALALINFAYGCDAQMIFMSTHSRKGLERFWLGSFTESVIALTKTTVVTRNPKLSQSEQVRRILFPTSLADASFGSFESALQLAKNMEASLVLYHRFSPPVEPIRDAGIALSGGAWISVDQFLIEDEKLRRAQGDKWLQMARAQGVKGELQFTSGTSPLPDAIIKAAEDLGADMICIESRSGPGLTGFFSSIPRHVVRDATRPVMVLRNS